MSKSIVFLLDADEVVDVGVPYENLQVSLVLEIKFEVVSGAMFSQFDENPSVRGRVVMDAGTGVSVLIMVVTAGSQQKSDAQEDGWIMFHKNPFYRSIQVWASARDESKFIKKVI